jgi:hypothetical protein
MRLLTEALENRFAQIGVQNRVSDPIIVARYFYPAGRATWYATEYDPDVQAFFGYISLYGDENDEWGYFSLEELVTFKGRFGLGVERDLFWHEQTASQVIPGFTGWRE